MVGGQYDFTARKNRRAIKFFIDHFMVNFTVLNEMPYFARKRKIDDLVRFGEFG